MNILCIFKIFIFQKNTKMYFSTLGHPIAYLHLWQYVVTLFDVIRCTVQRNCQDVILKKTVQKTMYCKTYHGKILPSWNIAKILSQHLTLVLISTYLLRVWWYNRVGKSKRHNVILNYFIFFIFEIHLSSTDCAPL